MTTLLDFRPAAGAKAKFVEHLCKETFCIVAESLRCVFVSFQENYSAEPSLRRG